MIDLTGALLGSDSIDSSGNIYNAQLDPDAYNYLASNGYVGAAASAITFIIPGVGELVIIIVVTLLAAAGAVALHEWAVARGQTDPIAVRTNYRKRNGWIT